MGNFISRQDSRGAEEDSTRNKNSTPADAKSERESDDIGNKMASASTNIPVVMKTDDSATKKEPKAPENKRGARNSAAMVNGNAQNDGQGSSRRAQKRKPATQSPKTAKVPRAPFISQNRTPTRWVNRKFDKIETRATIISDVNKSDDVRVLKPGVDYDAKVLEVAGKVDREEMREAVREWVADPTKTEKLMRLKNQQKFFIHYVGYNSRTDEWVDLDQLLVNTKNQEEIRLSYEREFNKKVIEKLERF